LALREQTICEGKFLFSPKEAHMHTSLDDSGYAAGSNAGKEQGIKIYCRIFEDMIPTDTCELRKQTLNTFRWSSCSGCAIGLAHYWMGNYKKE
jgi:hypothetical protein